MDTPTFQVTIYGARGSLPNTCKDTQKYGGSTTCLGVECADKSLIVMDAGTGIADLGRILVGSSSTVKEIHLLLTHTHWDHTMGLPYFLPLWDPLFIVHIYMLAKENHSLEDTLSSMFDPSFFPVPYQELPASIKFHELGFDDDIHIGSTTVKCCRANHPGYALGYRLEHGRKSIFFASDSAPFTDILFEDRFHERKRENDPRIVERMRELDQVLRRTILDADIMFFDANFSDEQYEAIFHWGHSSMRQAYELARECNVKRLVLWHHDRSRTDSELEAFASEFIEKGKLCNMTVELAQASKRYDL